MGIVSEAKLIFSQARAGQARGVLCKERAPAAERHSAAVSR